MKPKQKSNLYTKIIPHYLIIVLIFVLGILVYHRSLLKGVFLFDDNGLIIENPLIKNFSYLKDIFTTHLFHGSGIYSNFYRPMQSLSFMFDYHFWELNPFGYHLSSVLIHIFSAILVYFLIYILSKKQYIALVTSLLFCVHTVLSWPVNYIASRADLLSMFFFLLAMILYILYKQHIQLDRRSWFLFLSSIVCFVLSILSKEVAAVLPFILLLYLWCFSSPQKRFEKRLPNLIWVFFIILGIYILLRMTVLDFTEGKLLETTTGKIPLYNRLLTTSKVFMIYLRLLFLPVGLHMEWNIEPARSIVQDEVFLSVIGLFIIGVFGYFLARRSKLKFFAIGWFFITLLPFSNIVPLNYFMGEGWLYVPAVGFFMLIAIYLFDLKGKSRLHSSIVSIVVSLLIAFYGFLTIKRADVWADPVKLYNEILRYSPTSSKARVNLGVLLAKSGSHDEAIKKYKEAAMLKPDDPGVHANLGTVYANKKMYDMALEEFKKAVEFNPDDYVAHNNIGIIYKQRGKIKEAIEEYKKALVINPNYTLTYNNIGNIYLDSGQYDIAMDFYKKAINLDPNKAAFHGNLGKAYRKKGMLKEAREAFEKALQLDPHHKDAINGLKSLN